MRPEFISGPFLETVWAIGILLISIFIGWLILLGVRYIERKIEKQTHKPVLLSQLLESLTRPLFLLVILEGLLFGLDSLSYTAQWSDILVKSRIVLLLVLVIYTLARIAGVLISWYLKTATVRRRARVDEGLIRLLRRILTIIIYAIGILVVLDYLNISITPIVAGLGIGGLAVALALQPTLGNFFAGTQIVSDRVIRVGDYIELDGSSIKGYVTDIGWRSTRIRTPFNNMVIIPNSRLADSVLTNYYGPTMEIGITISCGVSYNANLSRVEAIALEVAREVVEELDDADKTFEPWFNYEEFGDSNINFLIWVRAKDRMGSFHVRSEIIKRLKAALDKEGITINYPARLLTFDDATLPPAFRASRQDSERKK